MTQEIDAKELEELLGQLYTDEARLTAIASLIGVYAVDVEVEDTSEEWSLFGIHVEYARRLESNIQDCEKRGEFHRAVFLTNLMDNPSPKNKQLLERAIENYEKIGYFMAAGMLAMDSYMDERAIENFEKSGDYNWAIAIAQSKGMDDKVRELHRKNFEMFEECGLFDSAAREAREKGFVERVNVYGSLANLFPHGRVPKDKEINLRVLEDLLSKLYTDEGRLGIIAILMREDIDIPAEYTERVKSTIKDLERTEDYGKAGNLAQKAGMEEKAIELYEKAGLFFNVGKIIESAGDYKKALEYFEKDGWLFEVLERPDSYDLDEEKIQELSRKAIEGFEQKAEQNKADGGSSLRFAMQIAGKAGMTKKYEELYQKTIEAYTMEGRPSFALDIARANSDIEKELEIYERYGHFWEAKEVAEKAGMTEKVKVYQTLQELLDS
ncbi:hypothetical protein GOV06_05825 [Candidatus Woesearchaeota archaeon]|nr:hypothetical protein [Candidatus Woesearchaeota archaeon]